MSPFPNCHHSNRNRNLRLI